MSVALTSELNILSFKLQDRKDVFLFLFEAMNKLFRIQEIKKDKILAFFRLVSERAKADVSDDNQKCVIVLRGIDIDIQSY